MDALKLLLERQSHPRLVEPAPSSEALDNIMSAALRAPDHACLAPWKFVVCEGDGLQRLGKLYEHSAVQRGKPDKDIQRASQLPLRAPMVIVAINRHVEHEKVPQVEQIASTACAVMAMQMAALAQGFNGMWRTGSYARCDYVKQGFDLRAEDEIVGFLYLGTPMTQAGIKPTRDTNDYFTFWREE